MEVVGDGGEPSRSVVGKGGRVAVGRARGVGHVADRGEPAPVLVGVVHGVCIGEGEGGVLAGCAVSVSRGDIGSPTALGIGKRCEPTTLCVSIGAGKAPGVARGGGGEA